MWVCSKNGAHEKAILMDGIMTNQQVSEDHPIMSCTNACIWNWRIPPSMAIKWWKWWLTIKLSNLGLPYCPIALLPYCHCISGDWWNYYMIRRLIWSVWCIVLHLIIYWFMYDLLFVIGASSSYWLLRGEGRNSDWFGPSPGGIPQWFNGALYHSYLACLMYPVFTKHHKALYEASKKWSKRLPWYRSNWENGELFTKRPG